MILFDEKVIHQLSKVQEDGYGALFYNSEKCIKEQTNFIKEIVETVRPKRVIEIGTNKAYFDYFILTIDNNILIDTFEVWPIFQYGVDLVNSIFGNKVTLYLGDSVKTFTKFNPEYMVDLAFIDGDHEAKSLIDMMNCERLKINHIIIDDCNIGTTVRTNANIMCDEFNWKFIKRTADFDDRGMSYFTRGNDK
jgi:hypothetical protein